MIDWPSFLSQHRIEYITSGRNVARGNIAIHCPWCGAADPSHHLGIALDGQGWGCLRVPSHRGRNPARLVQALLGCSWAEAHRLMGNTFHLSDDFGARPLSFDSQETNYPRKLKLPPEFKPFADLPSCRPYANYLASRDYNHSQILNFTERYNLRYCTSGPYRGRIIFPITTHDKLVTWTGRSIYKRAFLRYKTLSADPTKAREERLTPAVKPITSYLLWYDDLIKSGAHTIVLVEGPFDALRVCTLGQTMGITSTCFFTSAPTIDQINLLYEVLPRFQHRYLLLDEATLSTTMHIEGLLSALGVRGKRLPDGVKDPALLNARSFKNLWA